MFVQNLNMKQQSALLYLAHEVAKSDDQLHDAELGIIDTIRAQSCDGVEEKAITLDELPLIFDSEKAKCSLILELIGVALVNEEYHQNEKKLIDQYANALNIEQNKLFQLEWWVSKQFALIKEAKQFFN